MTCVRGTPQFQQMCPEPVQVLQLQSGLCLPAVTCISMKGNLGYNSQETCAYQAASAVSDSIRVLLFFVLFCLLFLNGSLYYERQLRPNQISHELERTYHRSD